MVLTSGLLSAPYPYTKGFLPLLRYWRGLGIHLVLYLDDAAGYEKDRVDFSSYESNRVNFVALLQLLAKGNDPLQKHLLSSSREAKYTRKTIKNDFIHLYGCFLASPGGSSPPLPLKNRALRNRSHPYQIPRVNTERFKKCFVLMSL